MPTIGRGGAGNIQAHALETARNADDLEANHSDAPPSAETLPPAHAREEPLYAHTGRGGAGNYYSPRDLRATGQFIDAQSSHIFGDGTPAPDSGIEGAGAGPAVAAAAGASASSAPATTHRSSTESKRSVATTAPQVLRSYGRGGAGNLIYGVSEGEWRAAEKVEETRRKEEKIKVDTEKLLQDTLPVPPKAKLPGPEP